MDGNLVTARKEWERLTEPDPQPGNHGTIQDWRRRGKARAWLDWEHSGPGVFALLNFRRDDDGKGEGETLLRLLMDICDRHQVAMVGTVAPQRAEQIGNDQLEDFITLARFYEGIGIQVTGIGTFNPKLRYPPLR